MRALDAPQVPVVAGIASWLAEVDVSKATETYRVDPELSVEIREHAVATAHGPRAGTSFVTRGLGSLGHPELVFTWCGPRLLGTPAAAAIAAMRTIARAAAAGLELRAATAYHLGAGAMLEAVGLTGVVFVPAQVMPGLDPPRGALHAVGVTAAELALVARAGVHRLMSRLGRLHDRFPWPAWSSPRRSVGAADETTALAGLPHAIVPGLVVALDGTDLSIRVPRASATALNAAIHDPSAVYAHGIAIAGEPDRDADAHLLWLDDRRETIAVSAPRARGRRTAGGFLHVAGGDALRATVLEDGFSLAFDPDSRSRLAGALANGLGWIGRAEAGVVRVTMI